MKILLLTAYFPPEIGSASHLLYELGREFVRKGHVVSVLTGYPVYNIDPSSLPDHYETGWVMREEMDGMAVVRIRAIGMPRHIPVLRGIGQFTFSLAAILAGLVMARGRKDAILVYSPPLFLGISALVLRFFLSAKVVVNVQDLFPQSAIDLGVLKNRILIAAFRAIERCIYKRSDFISVHSLGNKAHVERCGGDAARAIVVPNPVDTRSLRPGPRDGLFRTEHGVSPEHFLVSFAGVIGLSQDLDTVIDAARLMARQERVLFYVVGDGLEKERLVRKAEGLKNVVFLPMLPLDQYAGLLHASDVCLVTLRKEVRTPVVPSKILSIMAAGRPVVASMPLDGDAPQLIRDAACGICVPPERPDELARAIAGLAVDRAGSEVYGQSGRAYAEKYLSLESCATMYEHIFQSDLST